MVVVGYCTRPFKFTPLTLNTPNHHKNNKVPLWVIFGGKQHGALWGIIVNIPKHNPKHQNYQDAPSDILVIASNPFHHVLYAGRGYHSIQHRASGTPVFQIDVSHQCKSHLGLAETKSKHLGCKSHLNRNTFQRNGMLHFNKTKSKHAWKRT